MADDTTAELKRKRLRMEVITALMMRSGLGAESQARMLEKLLELTPQAAGQETNWLASHPPVAERTEAIRDNGDRWEATAEKAGE